jgi:hypothetical protein
MRMGFIGVTLTVGLSSGCTQRSEPPMPLQSALAPLSVTVARRDLGDGNSEWKVGLRPTPGSEEWFERSAGRMRLGSGDRLVSLGGAGGHLEGLWRGRSWERPTLSWRATDGSAGLEVELMEDEEVDAPRFRRVPITGLVRAAVPLGETR